MKTPVYKYFSIFKCAICFVVKVYYNFVELTLFVKLSRLIPIKAPVTSLLASLTVHFVLL